MTLVKRKFWNTFAAFVTVVTTFFGLSSAKPAAGRTLEMRLADVRQRIESLEKEQGTDIRHALFPPMDQIPESETRVSQYWRDYRPWSNWRNVRPWSDWRDYRPWSNWRDYRWRNY